ncbi:putative Ig domain-containing protein, partial [Azospirillum sp.]|uniref:putative Ig domain-containing protein n=1 Tax=Azospirillum sp. TaxID=34012 RepID=UPI002D5D8017
MRGFRPLSEAEKTAARQALAAWAAVCGLSFVEVPPEVGGDIRFVAYAFHGFYGGPATYAYSSAPIGGGSTPWGHASDNAADVFLNTALIAPDDSFEPGGEWFEILLHEIGHALGLEHPPEGMQKLEAEENITSFTVLSYHSPAGWAQAPGPGDIEAVRYLYGADDGGVTARWDAAARAVVVSGDEAGNALYDTVRADRLDGGPGDDTLIGGPDATLALFSAAQSQYRFTAEPDGAVRVDGPDGADLLRHVRRVRFADGPAVAVSALPVRRWPEVVRPVPELTAAAAAGRRFRSRLAADTFHSPDGGRLTWRLRQEDGTALPGWLRFSAATRTLSGTVPAGAADLTLRVTARDAAGREAGDGFHLFITPAGGSGVRAAASPVPAARTVVRGNAGNNHLNGKARNEEFLCGAGDDDVRAGDGDDVAWGGDGCDMLYGGNGRDQLYGELDDDYLSGKAGDDSLSGGVGYDYLLGGEGTDAVFGGEGNDTLGGESGDDLVVGGIGADEFWEDVDRDAPAERNTLYGGTGDDTFYANGTGGYLDGGDGDDVLYV